MVNKSLQLLTDLGDKFNVIYLTNLYLSVCSSCTRPPSDRRAPSSPTYVSIFAFLLDFPFFFSLTPPFVFISLQPTAFPITTFFSVPPLAFNSPSSSDPIAHLAWFGAGARFQDPATSSGFTRPEDQTAEHVVASIEIGRILTKLSLF